MTDTTIINGPITKGCFVRLRNGGVCGPIFRNTSSEFFLWQLYEVMSWNAEGLYVSDPDDGRTIVEVIPTHSPPRHIQHTNKSCGIMIDPAIILATLRAKQAEMKP
jgi:hypothetical protein